MNSIIDDIDEIMTNSGITTNVSRLIHMGPTFYAEDGILFPLRNILGDHGIQDSITNVITNSFENNKIDGTIKNIIHG